MALVPDTVSAERFDELLREGFWYHTFGIAGVTTPGTFDLRPHLPAHHFPASLQGKSVLDIGAADGFYTFEFERLGAASVLAVDTNPFDGGLAVDPSPARRDTYQLKYLRYREDLERFGDVYQAAGLATANKLLLLKAYWDSRVEFQNGSIYELEALGQTFDVVFCGALIEHLKHPLLALEQLRAACREVCIITLSNALPSATGAAAGALKALRGVLRALGLRQYVSFHDHDKPARYVGYRTGGCFFWISTAAFADMLRAAGFARVELVDSFDLPRAGGGSVTHNAVFHAYVS